MATYKLVLDTRNKKTKKFPLVIRISHKSKWKYLKTGYKLTLNEWHEKNLKIKSPFPNSVRANNKIQKKLTIISDIFNTNNTIIKNMNLNEIIALIEEQIEQEENKKLVKISEVFNAKNKPLLKDYGKLVIERYNKAKRYGMVDSFTGAINLLLTFHGNDTLFLTDIDETFLEDLEADYISRGNTINGLGVRLRAIRRILNLAIKDKKTELTLEHYPFGKSGYSIKRENTKKRAISLDEINKIRQLSYPIASSLWHHRNYFLFMFNMRGMNFIDLSFLTLDAIKKNRIIYKRKKTKRGESVKEFNIKITQEAQEILNYYIQKKNKGDLVFPIMEDIIYHEDESRVHEVYKSRRKNHNRRLSTIGKHINLDVKLTTYVARHTFATAGLRKGLSKAQIGDMLGHTSYYTTETYLNGFEQEVLDEAADQILG